LNFFTPIDDDEDLEDNDFDDTNDFVADVGDFGVHQV
jgi:hypothetical protein